MADAQGLGPCVERRGGSSPLTRTMLKVGDVARCVRLGMWENSVKESDDDSYLILSANEYDELVGYPSYGILHLKSGKKHDRRLQDRYKERSSP